MNATVIAPTETAQQWLADRGLVVGARVGSCTIARQSGTVVAIASTADLTVRWDDGRTEAARWAAIAPYGYLVDVEDGLEADPVEELVTIGREGWWVRVEDDAELVAA